MGRLRRRRLRRQLKRAHERAVRTDPSDIYLPSTLSAQEQAAIWQKHSVGSWRTNPSRVPSD